MTPEQLQEIRKALAADPAALLDDPDTGRKKCLTRDLCIELAANKWLRLSLAEIDRLKSNETILIQNYGALKVGNERLRQTLDNIETLADCAVPSTFTTIQIAKEVRAALDVKS